MNRQHTVAGIVLAGGQSRRFGEPKAFAKRGGIPFYEYSLQVLDPFVDKIVIVTNSMLKQEFSNAPLSAELITDAKEYAGKGPLAGIFSAMKCVQADWYIVLPIDVPFIKDEVIAELVSKVTEDVEAVVPLVNGRTQPLVAMYHSSCAPKIVTQLERGILSINELLPNLHTQYISLNTEVPFININYKSDYRTFIQNEERGDFYVE